MTKNAVWDEEELSTIRNRDRLLPSQPYFSKMYKGFDFYGDMEKSLSLMYEPTDWDIKTKDGMTYAVMGSDLNTLRFYQFLIRSHGYKTVLELGTYIGVSTLYFAETGANVTSVEKGKEFFNIAASNVSNNGSEYPILLMNESADDYLKRTRRYYDFIFIDCAKEIYKKLLEMSLKRLSPGGMILVDDVFFQGDTLNKKPNSKKGRGVRAMLDYVATLKYYEKVILPLGNGLLMLRKS